MRVARKLCACTIICSVCTCTTPHSTPPHSRGSESETGQLTPTEGRGMVVKEILCTERNYVKHLEDIIEVKEHEILVLKDDIAVEVMEILYTKRRITRILVSFAMR